jgi:NAD(P)-dependent dehydrogenase (short-subunit alcohol dehydrogenase family)
MSAEGGRLRGKTALVTGAGSGIGRAIALRFAEEGAALVVTSRRAVTVDDVCAEIEATTGERPLGMGLDVSDADAAGDVMRTLAERWGGLDVLVSNAGVELVGSPPVAATTDAEWEGILAVNLTGAFYVIRAAWPLLRDGSSVVTIGSLNSFRPRLGAAAYAASKGGLLQLTRTVALELAPKGSRANCICPGNIDTPLTDAFVARAEDPERLRQSYAADAPLGRLGTPLEVANAALYLASDESRFVTGSALVIDGGMSLL